MRWSWLLLLHRLLLLLSLRVGQRRLLVRALQSVLLRVLMLLLRDDFHARRRLRKLVLILQFDLLSRYH